ncbi:hypothetical protein AAFF27_26740 [Xylophilus sp. GW821-FHT01B05]
MLNPDLYLRQLSWSDAQRFAQSRVTFFVGDTEAAAMPLDVIAVAERPPMAGGHQFTITFQGARSPVLPQQTYQVRHPELGDFAIFVTAIGQSAEATQYEACFSHVA